MRSVLEELTLYTKLDILDELIEEAIHGYDLSKCVSLSRGDNSATITSNILDEQLIFKFDKTKNRITLYTGSISAEINNKPQMEKLLVNALVNPCKDMCRSCKVGCNTRDY